ncbi:MAG TPA: flavin reductase family protein [Blastocatellia bacterium]|jgi:flavin reductase (DIM6/NTAB) family NADH-FMN oxidoreductase RutF|nr:flavin reductase family protein [Blastocatellia bacterium]
MAVGKEEFRRALGHFASGVTVVTSKGQGERPQGITVSAFTSVSLDPPLILVCIDKRASIHDHLVEGSYFAVSLLAEDQELISRRFASKEEDRFDGVGFTEGVTGSPLLTGSLAGIECRVVHAFPGGDHTIFVGEVEATAVTEGKPLLYFRGGYNQLA